MSPDCRDRAGAEARGKLAANVKFGPGTIVRFIDLYLTESDKMTKPRGEGGFADGTKLKALGIMRAHESPGGLFASILLADLDEESVEAYLAEIVRRRGTACAAMQRALLTNLWESAKGDPEFKRRGKSCPTSGSRRCTRRSCATRAT